MLLRDFLSVTAYDDSIILFKPIKTFEGIKWARVAKYTNSEDMENLIMSAYGDWIVFNCVQDYGNDNIYIYPSSMADEISHFNHKE